MDSEHERWRKQANSWSAEDTPRKRHWQPESVARLAKLEVDCT